MRAFETSGERARGTKQKAGERIILPPVTVLAIGVMRQHAGGCMYKGLLVQSAQYVVGINF